MDVHKNARSVPASRALLWKRVSEQGWSVRAASEAAGMSERRGREWIRRARQQEQLTDRSSRPRTPTGIAAELRSTIVRLRREWRTMRQIAQMAGVGTSTVARVCRAEGLSRLRALEPPEPVVRYERDNPGELIHVDTKTTWPFRPRRSSHHPLTLDRLLEAGVRVRSRRDRRRLASGLRGDPHGRIRRVGRDVPARSRRLVREVGCPCRARHDRRRAFAQGSYTKIHG